MSKNLPLKDRLFNPEKISFISLLISEVYPDFEKKKFTEEVLEHFPELELKDRIVWIRKCLKKYLPSDYETALTILLNALPEECDPTQSDNDFGHFILTPFSDFVAAYGCQKKQLELSLQALEEITKRVSAEDSIRYFLNAFPKETLNKMVEWSRNKNYHVRRLASEGSRPRLPWSQKVDLDSRKVISKILDNLFDDPTRYVIRSVANHLNDISKENPNLVIETLKAWQNSNKQTENEMNYLTRHALRTQIKAGNHEALNLLGYQHSANIDVSEFKILTSELKIGSTLAFSFSIHSHENTKLMIDYKLYFQSKNENQLPKVFKIKKVSMRKGETLSVTKKHPLKIMTTKKLYPGIHKLELQINGQLYEGGEFLLTSSST